MDGPYVQDGWLGQLVPDPRYNVPDHSLPERRCADGGYAMVIAVLASTLMVSVAVALVFNLSSGGSESVRQREIHVARSTGTSALDYMMYELGDEPAFLQYYLATTSPPAPAGWSDPDWLKKSGATAPVPGTDTDWHRLSDGTDGDLVVEDCASRQTCWTLRWSDEFDEVDGNNPETAVVEAIVRFNCERNFECSVRHFQQRIVKETSGWRRLDVTEVTGIGALS